MPHEAEGLAGTARRDRGWWAAAVLAGPPVAWLAATQLGLRIAPRSPIADLAWLAAWAAAEELVFRGLLQGWLAERQADGRSGPFGGDRRRLGITRANLVTSLVFTLAHLWQHTAAATAAVFPVSLVLGVAREKSGGVRAPIALHLYYNVCLYAASLLTSSR